MESRVSLIDDFLISGDCAGEEGGRKKKKKERKKERGNYQTLHPPCEKP
jgi:hypothetical protein